LLCDVGLSARCNGFLAVTDILRTNRDRRHTRAKRGTKWQIAHIIRDSRKKVTNLRAATAIS
jgi:hypothetical protein